MVSLSIRGMTGWVNPFFLAMRRPGTLSVARRRSAGAFFVGTPALVRPSFWRIMQRTPLGLDGPRGGCSPPEGRLACGFKPLAFSHFLWQSADFTADCQSPPEGVEKTQDLIEGTHNSKHCKSYGPSSLMMV
jgi:hypothetical protein